MKINSFIPFVFFIGTGRCWRPPWVVPSYNQPHLCQSSACTSATFCNFHQNAKFNSRRAASDKGLSPNKEFSNYNWMYCTHIKVRKCGGDAAQYYINRKGFYSLNVQVNNLFQFSTCCETNSLHTFRYQTIL